ncbi:MAG: ATP-dependent Clp protease proteolytic subunit [Betaproteobacteria bacterium]
MTKIGLLLGSALLACTAQALSLHREGGDLYASGVIQVGDDLALRAAHAQAPVERLILVNSPGGALMASLRIAHWLEDLRITTLAAGHCMSACSLIFMAGEQRQFASLPKHPAGVIGIHGAYNARTGQASQAAAPLMLDYYRHRMGANYAAAIMEQAVHQMKDPSGFLVVPAMSAGEQAEQRPQHCPSARSSRHECTVHLQQSALSLGIVTRAETVSLAGLPDALAQALQAAPAPAAPSPFNTRAQARTLAQQFP